MTNVEITYCDIDRLYYIRRNDKDIHYQQDKPNDTDIIEASMSDNWAERFEDMRQGKRVRVSMRIFYDMLGSVPPIRQTAESFYCGEAYSDNLYYFFEKVDGKYYGQLKELV